VSKTDIATSQNPINEPKPWIYHVEGFQISLRKRYPLQEGGKNGHFEHFFLTQ
jgi:hypothetical protein